MLFQTDCTRHKDVVAQDARDAGPLRLQVLQFLLSFGPVRLKILALAVRLCGDGKVDVSSLWSDRAHRIAGGLTPSFRVSRSLISASSRVSLRRTRTAFSSPASISCRRVFSRRRRSSSEARSSGRSVLAFAFLRLRRQDGLIRVERCRRRSDAQLTVLGQVGLTQRLALLLAQTALLILGFFCERLDLGEVALELRDGPLLTVLVLTDLTAENGAVLNLADRVLDLRPERDEPRGLSESRRAHVSSQLNPVERTSVAHLLVEALLLALEPALLARDLCLDLRLRLADPGNLALNAALLLAELDELSVRRLDRRGGPVDSGLDVEELPKDVLQDDLILRVGEPKRVSVPFEASPAELNRTDLLLPQLGQPLRLALMLLERLEFLGDLTLRVKRLGRERRCLVENGLGCLVLLGELK